MKTIGFGAFLLLGLAAVSASAADLKGSDTLADVTKAILAACDPDGAGPLTSIPSTDINYIGGGSGAGQDAMKALSQQIAPMSRALNNGVCNTAGVDVTKAENMAIGLDGLSIVGDADATLGCGGVQGAGVAWKATLRLLFGGDVTAGAYGTTAACNAASRSTLINTWGNLFAGTCTSGQCTKLRHVFRRDDKSGTTDTFLSVIGLPSISAKPFCNGTDRDDVDPIRVACDANEQVCNYYKVPAPPTPAPLAKTLGVVLAIATPDNKTVADAYSLKADGTPNACATGNFKSRAPATGWTACPNNDAFAFGACLTPVDAANNSNCLNASSNSPTFCQSGNCLSDGRVYNLTLRKGTVFTDIQRNPANVQITNAFYRIHTSKVIAGTPVGVPCKESSATKQIGCLTQASPCSLGFAGLEAGTVAGADSLAIDGVVPSIPNIQAFPAPGSYPLTRKLYLNTLLGFENVTNTGSSQRALSECFANKAIVDTALNATGFVPFAGPALACEDFDEQALCGASTNVNACAGNPLPFPSAP